MAMYAITTTDNPYDPFTQYDLWASYDEAVCGYYTNSYLARITGDTTELSGPDTDRVIEDAIDEIIAMNLPLTCPLTGTRVQYRKVERADSYD